LLQDQKVAIKKPKNVLIIEGEVRETEEGCSRNSRQAGREERGSVEKQTKDLAN